MKKKKELSKPNLLLPSKWLILGGVIILVIVISLVYKKYSLGVKNIFSETPISTGMPAKSQLNIQILGPSEGSLSQEEYANLAIADLGRKLGIDKKVIKLIKAEPKDWSNTSLGCPEKNLFYTEVITPGYIIELSTLGKTYIYHAGSNRVVTCKNQ